MQINRNKMFRKAAQIVPSNGQPYNQLAILASPQSDMLSTVFFYLRAIYVKARIFPCFPFQLKISDFFLFLGKISDFFLSLGKISDFFLFLGKFSFFLEIFENLFFIETESKSALKSVPFPARNWISSVPSKKCSKVAKNKMWNRRIKYPCWSCCAFF